MTEEIYAMPFFVRLIVRDPEVSSKWYQDVLGFKHIFTLPGPEGQPALVHLRWVKYADLLLSPLRDGEELPEPRGAGVSLNFSMFDRFGGSVDTLADQARTMGANILSGPLERLWDVRELTIRDPNGYQLIFTAPLNTNLNFDEVVKRASSQK